jgi:alpha-keto-acid decarboxylase
MTSYTVTDYLLDRLAEAGVDRMFGVPGDFTLAMLDHVEDHPTVDWVGCSNELGAGYAADGYARMRGIGVLCTTFGVGELSAINAVAGSYAEHVPVIHVVGSPSIATQTAGRATHHTLGDGDFRHFARMTTEVTCAQGYLTVENATSEIDRVIAEAIDRRLPGYLLIPADVAMSETERPQSAMHLHPQITNPNSLKAFREAAASLLGNASTVSVLADILVQRMGARSELERLLAYGLPVATLLWGRRVVDESLTTYVGAYVGAVSAEPVRAAIEDPDVLIMVGVEFTDLTSAFFTQRLSEERTVDVGANSARIGQRTYGPISMSDAIDALTEIVGGLDGQLRRPEIARLQAPDLEPGDPTRSLTQESLWKAVSGSLRSGDLVLADQGTAFYGISAHSFPRDLTFVGQPLWAAIGFTLPALLGAALAAPELRPILLIGDGAAQLTVAELGTLIRNRVPATIVVVNNDGYTIERAIHGPDAVYNDIASWNWTALLGALDPEGTSVGITARTVGELTDALDSVGEGRPDHLTLIEVVVPRLDVPPLLASLAGAAAAANTSRH